MFSRFAIIFDNNTVHTFYFWVNLTYTMLWYSSEKENAKWISLLFHPLSSVVIHNNLLVSSPIVYLKSCSVLYTDVILLGPCSLSYNLSVFSFTFLSSFFLLFLDVFISFELQLYNALPFWSFNKTVVIWHQLSKLWSNNKRRKNSDF